MKQRIRDWFCLRICVGREGGDIFHHLISFKNIGFDLFISFEPEITKLIFGSYTVNLTYKSKILPVV